MKRRAYGDANGPYHHHGQQHKRRRKIDPYSEDDNISARDIIDRILQNDDDAKDRNDGIPLFLKKPGGKKSIRTFEHGKQSSKSKKKSGKQKRKLHRSNSDDTDETSSDPFDNEESCCSSSDEDDWAPGILPIDTGIPCEKRKFCFLCSHVGENTPEIKRTSMQELAVILANGLRTTDPNQHYINVSNFYEEKIRAVSNKRQLDRDKNSKKLLPPWPPSMVKEHLERHNNDPELSVELMMYRFKHLFDFIFMNSLIEKKKRGSSKKKQRHNHKKLTNVKNSNNNKLTKSVPIPDDEEDVNRNRKDQTYMHMTDDYQTDFADDDAMGNIPSTHHVGNAQDSTNDIENIDENDDDDENANYEYRVNPQQWAIAKSVVEMYIKLGKSNPQTMVPFYKKDRFIIEGHTKHPFIDTSTKDIVDKSIGRNGDTTENMPSTCGGFNISQKSVFNGLHMEY